MRSSGNHAFDEYRDETLRRLEEEEREFKEFLDRLRQAKDKAEFDQFMAEMRGRRPPKTAPRRNRRADTSTPLSRIAGEGGRGRQPAAG